MSRVPCADNNSLLRDIDLTQAGDRSGFEHRSSGVPQFAQQARVLHRDYSLSSKVLQQRDLLAGERLDFLSENGDATKKDALFAQRYAEEAG